VTKACTIPAIAGQPAGTVTVGQAVACTLTVTFPAAPVAPVAGTITTTGGTTAPAAFSCPAGAAVCTVSETLTPSTAGTLPAETVVVAGTTFTPASGITAVIPTGANITIMELTNCSVAGVVGGTFETTGAATLVRCRINLRETGPTGGATPTPDLVSSGIVNLTVGGGPFGTVVSAITCPVLGGGVTCAGTVNGPTATVRCGAQNTQDTCDFVDIDINVAAPAQVGQSVFISLDGNYVPDNPALNTPANLNRIDAFRVTRIAVVTNCRELLGIRLVGFSPNIGAQPGTNLVQPVRPGEIGTATGGILAIGVLPQALRVDAIPLVDDPATAVYEAVPVRPGLGVCPGKFEVSSINGTLLSLSGTLSTNLRILCGSETTNIVRTGLGTFDTNTCTSGVTFSVLGLGVGDVEINVRYEPLDGSLLCSDIQNPPGTCEEFEVVGRVRFVAPVVTLTLSLDPNPVAVGATTRATANLLTVTAANCAAINPAAVTTCIDPSTGRVITSFSDAGSVLNGIVVFSVDNTAIAQFVEPGIANAGTTLQTGVVATASQVIRECGAFSGQRNTTPFSLVGGFAAEPIANFFGGCQTATATLRGINPGSTNVAASFVPFLPGAASAIDPRFGTTLTTQLGAAIAQSNFFAPAIGNSTSIATLQVAGVAPTGNIDLVRGCNNVTPTVSEAASAYAARVTPANAVIAIWEHQAATNTFRGAPGAGSPASAQAVADLTNVTRLRPVFVCVNAAAQLAQPPA
jgi:hypothetical protein